MKLSEFHRRMAAEETVYLRMSWGTGRVTARGHKSVWVCPLSSIVGNRYTHHSMKHVADGAVVMTFAGEVCVETR